MKKMLLSIVVAGSVIVSGLGLTSFEQVTTETISVSDIVKKEISSVSFIINGEQVTTDHGSHSKLFLYKDQGISSVDVSIHENKLGFKQYQIEKTY